MIVNNITSFTCKIAITVNSFSKLSINALISAQLVIPSSNIKQFQRRLQSRFWTMKGTDDERYWKSVYRFHRQANYSSFPVTRCRLSLRNNSIACWLLIISLRFIYFFILFLKIANFYNLRKWGRLWDY